MVRAVVKGLLGPLICVAFLCLPFRAFSAPATAAPATVAPTSADSDVHEPPGQPLGREAERATPGLVYELSVLRGSELIGYPRAGAGLRWGESVLHLGLVLEGGYDSNFEMASEGNEYPSGYLRLVPRLSLSNRRAVHPRDVEYVVGLVVDCFGIPSGDRVEDWGGVGVRGDVGVTIRRETLRFHLWDRVTRTLENLVDTEPFVFGQAVRLHNVSEIGLTMEPPSSRFSFDVAYRFTLELFEDDRYDFASRMRHDLRLGVRRRFRPWLILGLSVETGHVDHFEEVHMTSVIGGPLAQNSMTLRAQVTADLRFGRRVRARAALGYGGAFLNDTVYSDDVRHHDVVAEAGGRFQLANDTYLWAGIWHDFRSPYGGEHLQVDGAVLRLHVAKIRDLVFDVATAWALTNRFSYHDGDVGGQHCEDAGGYIRCMARNHFVQLSVLATGHLLPWLSVSVGYVLQAGVHVVEDYSLISMSTTLRYDTEFLRHRAFGRLSAHY